MKPPSERTYDRFPAPPGKLPTREERDDERRAQRSARREAERAAWMPEQRPGEAWLDYNARVIEATPDPGPTLDRDDVAAGFPELDVGNPFARGATSHVYLATRRADGMRLAVKVMIGKVLQKPLRAERIRREARIMTTLRHARLVSIVDYRELDGHPCLVMEHIEGPTLHEHIRRGDPPGLSLDETLALAIQLCDGLAHAHQSGITHRDVKPHNCIVSPTGWLTLVDFGIARVGLLPGEVTLTHTNDLLGSPAYMSPEQRTNPKEVDARTDVHAVGVVLHEMLHGHRPAVNERTLRVQLPALGTPVDGVIARATMEFWSERYPTIRHLRHALLELQGR